MSRLSNGSSPSRSGHSNGHAYTHAEVDYHKIAQICLAGLREANNGQKEISERCDVIEHSVAELRNDMDLRISPLESSHQTMQTLLHENETLKESLTLLSKSIDPTWKSSIEARLANHDLLTQKVQKMEDQMATMARLLEAKLQTAEHVTPPAPQFMMSPKTAGSTNGVQSPVHPASGSSNFSLPSPVAPARSGIQAATSEPATPPRAAQAPAKSLDKPAIEQVITKKSEYAKALDACSTILAKVGDTNVNDGRLESPLNTDVPAFGRVDFSAPLVDKKAFEHKRDWVQAWQQALQRVQDDLRKTDELLSRKAAALQSRERDLQHKQGIVLDAGSRLHTLLSRMREDCDAIASVKAMQEDHEEELLKRLEQVQEQEYIIRQDSYIISNKGKRPYEKEAADFRRVEELRGLKRELETRIKEVTDYEQELLHSSTKGGAPSAGRLPRTDDLPDI